MEALNKQVAIGLSAFAATGAVEAVQVADVFAAQQPAAVEQQVQVQQPTFQEFLAKQAPAHEVAVEAPVAHAASVFHWDVVGGAPLVEGGIHTKKEAADLLKSDTGTKVMEHEGLSAAQRTAVRKALGKNGKNMYKSNIPPNVEFDKMVSKDYDTEGPVVLNGEKYPDGIPAFCVRAVRKFTKAGKEVKETIRQCIAEPCGNAALMGIKRENRNKPTPKKPKTTTAPVKVYKNAVDAYGKLMDKTPTGTFQFALVKGCYQNGKLLKPRTIVYNRPGQTLANCDVSYTNKKTHKVLKRLVTVEEPTKVVDGKTFAVTLGADKWMPLVPTVQTHKMTSKGAEFVFKNAEVPPTCADELYKNSPLCKTPEIPTTPVTPTTPETPACPAGTNFDDKNHNGKIDNDECVIPKDGTQGAGAGTPGTGNDGSTVGGPSGTGSNPAPGNPEASYPCYDSPDSSNGDLDPTTEGDIMYVNSTSKVDQQHYCVGPAETAVNG